MMLLSFLSLSLPLKTNKEKPLFSFSREKNLVNLRRENQKLGSKQNNPIVVNQNVADVITVSPPTFSKKIS